MPSDLMLGEIPHANANYDKRKKETYWTSADHFIDKKNRSKCKAKSTLDTICVAETGRRYVAECGAKMGDGKRGNAILLSHCQALSAKMPGW